MPVLEIVAPDWDYDADLDGAGLFAASYRVRYQHLDEARVWDHELFAGTRLYRGEDDPTIVRIRVRANQFERLLVEGVVDRLTLARDGSGYVGEIAGRDRAALLLDRRAAAPFTIPAGATFQTAINRLCEDVGLTADFACPDYPLGRDLAVTRERPLADYLEELLVPLRWGERRRVDAWIEGDTLRIADRALAVRGTVTVAFERDFDERFDVDALPAQTVRVEGAAYDVLVPDLIDPRRLPSEDVQTVEQGDVTTTVTTRTVEEYDDHGRLARRDKNIRTLVLEGITTLQDTTEIQTMVAGFAADPPTEPSLALAGKRLTETETWSKTRPSDGLLRTYKTITRTWTYDARGEVATEIVGEIELDVETGDQVRHTTTRYRYVRDGGQVIRHHEIREVEVTTGAVRRTVGQAEVGAAAEGELQLDIVPPGFRRETRRFAAGPEDADRVETSELLGSDAACAMIRDLILEDYAGERVRGTITLMPDARALPGMALVVQGAPATWPAAVFYVPGMNWSRSSPALRQSVEVRAWRD